MVDKAEFLTSRFKLEQEEASVYILVREKGRLSPLEISKKLNIPRSSVYRYLENLEKLGFINEDLAENSGKRYIAADDSVFSMVLNDKKAELETIEAELEEFKQAFQSTERIPHNNPSIKYYTGVDGLKRITWNSLDADPDEGIRICEIASMSAFLPEKFTLKVRHELLIRKIRDRQLTNSIRLPRGTNLLEYIENFWEVRYINPDILEITFETLIYNDITAFYTYQAGQVYCTEIEDPVFTKMQKQQFDLIWDRAREMGIDQKGNASIRVS